MRRARDLAGQVVVITGAARGIGACTARRLAARNAQVALLGLEPGELAERVRPMRSTLPLVAG